MDEQFYKKVGKKYVKVGYSDRFEITNCAEGIWLVINRPGSKSAECIQQIGEIPSVYPYANLAMHKEKMVSSVLEYYKQKGQELFDKLQTSHGAWELVEKILKDLAKDLKPSKN